MDKEQLVQYRNEIHQSLVNESFLIFPSNLNTEVGGIRAEWPEQKELRDFLNLAKGLGVKIVYFSDGIFDKEKLQEYKDDLEGEESEESQELLNIAKSHLGSTYQVSIQWVYEGVIHDFVKRAQWYLDLERKFDEIMESLEEDDGELEGEDWDEEDQSKEDSEKIQAERVKQWREKKERKDKKIQELAEQLVNIRNFQKGISYDAQCYICRQTFPHLKDQWLNDDPDDDNPSVREVVNLARQIYEFKIKPQLEKELANKARQMMASGESKTEVAIQLGISDNKLRRILVQYHE